MELTFNNNAAEFRAETAFNLHIEGSPCSLYRRTSGTQWDFVKTLNGAVIDEDVANNIPKDYRIVCAEAPKRCVVTFADGTTLEGLFPYEVFNAKDGAFLTAEGKTINVLKS